ncbi:MAG: NADH-quinone oxidoreductase subunit L [Limisphaerales bacterium]
MEAMLANVGWIPVLPLLAAGVIAFLPRGAKGLAQGLALGAMAVALVMSVVALAGVVANHGGATVTNFGWFRVGQGAVRLGWVVDPLAVVMLVMVSLVGLLIFVFSTGYMAHDANVTRFFCFLSLFAAAMLGVVIANSLLLLFMCWEVMGLASYLLIGFWFHKPSAAAAARKAFLVTRIGDLGLFLGMLWLYRDTGTLLFYDGGQGCLETTALAALTSSAGIGAISAATAIGLLLFVGAVGKSGQLPLHVWLPDAMEGPTPVSALIHAATMVAAGVFLMARVFPLMTGGSTAPLAEGGHLGLGVMAWVGAVTAVFAALIAVGQSDIKRILAYSTVSQLGYMFLGLGTGGVGVAMFHLLTHAFFKALLFLGAGSVIHGCHEEQDIRRMGGLRRAMPVTFATYAVGMMALCGVPLLFSGFWSKDEILHSAWLWRPGRGPFALGLIGALLTAFYMTRQVSEVFLGRNRGDGGVGAVHESPRVMTVPLVILAIFAVLLGFLGTPAWPWLEAFLSGHEAHWDPGHLAEAVPMMAVSTGVVLLGLGFGWWLYGRHGRVTSGGKDRLEALFPKAFAAMRGRFWVDEIYGATVVWAFRSVADFVGWFDAWVIAGLVRGVGAGVRGLAYVMRWVDELFVNPGFDSGCGLAGWLGRVAGRLQNGRAPRYLGLLGLGMVALAIWILWGVEGS